MDPKRTTGLKEMIPERKKDILTEEFALKEILTSKLRQNVSWRNIKRAIQNYINANFTNIEEDTLKFIITEMKGMYRKYNIIDIRGAHGIYVISYPVYVVPYSDWNKVTYRIVALMKEYGKGYVVLDRRTISVNLNSTDNKYYDYNELTNAISGFLDLVLDYDYEIVEKEAFIDFSELKMDGRIRIQGDLILRYEKYPIETFQKIIKGEIKDVLANLLVQDAIRYISKKLSLYRIEHSVNLDRNRTLIEILVNKSQKDYADKVTKAIEKIIEKELNLTKLDYEIRTAYRCFYGLNMCGYIVSLDLHRLNIVERIGSTDIVDELAESVMAPRKHILNIGNHVASFIAYDNVVYVDMNLPYTGQTVREFIRYSASEYFIEPGNYDIEVIHNEHGTNRLKVESDMGLVVTWITIDKPRIHEIIRNKLALRRFIS